MAFTDIYERTIDGKNRLQIPSQVRGTLEEASQPAALYLVPGSRPETLSLYPVGEFEAMAQQIEHEPFPDEDALTFQQLFYSMASRLDMDKQGRVVLPDRLLQRAGIQDAVVLTGAGNHLDLWRRETYREFVDRNWSRWRDVQKQARAASRKSQIKSE